MRLLLLLLVAGIAAYFTVPTRAQQEAAARTAMQGYRPDVAAEHFSLDDAGVPAEIVLVEPMGSETQVTMKLGETQVTGVFRERVSMAPGAIIHVRPELSNIHLFAADGGERLN